MQRSFSLERNVVDAWPAADTEALGPWLLRASGGPTHRGNSVATASAAPAPDDAELTRWVDAAERWYEARGRAPMFQVGPCAAPALDTLLSARGYVVEGPAITQSAAPDDVLARCLATRETVVERAPSGAWLDVAGRASRFASTYDVFLGFLARLGERARYVSARDEGGHIGSTCLCVVSSGRVGIYAMFTRDAERRRGGALSMLRAAAQLAHVEGAAELYLQVERENAGARALYERAGFHDEFAYHYRGRPRS